MQSVSLFTPATTKQPSPDIRPADGIAAASKRAELKRILDSADFPGTPRRGSILSYVVERHLNEDGGRARVTACEIAIEVLGRPENFDFIRDPIVRIEMAKLRRDLETYYLKSGRNNPLRIEIPRGGYDPLFLRQSPQEEPAEREAMTVTGNRAADASAELQRVLGSKDFSATPRNRKFLEFVVERELAGAIEEITPKSIAKHALGRGSSFNPNVDPIVRIEAGRLRRDLETYYLKGGKHNPIRISIPKGSYRPVFSHHKG